MITDIRARILARRDLDELRAARDLSGLAAALNAEGVLVRQSRFVTARVILALHKTEGRDIMRRLRELGNQDIGVEFSVTFLSQGSGIDIGDPGVWDNIDDLVAIWRTTGGIKGLSDTQGEMLKSLALLPLAVTRDDVRIAMFNDDGTEK